MAKSKSTTTKKKTTGFAILGKALEKEPRLPGDNFRKRAERIGVPPDKVQEFKYWLQGKAKLV